MRILSIILVLLIAAQPVQAGFCDMERSDGAAQHSGVQHPVASQGHIQQVPNPHALMGHETGQGNAGHDCCAYPESGPGKGCGTLDQCGSCTAGLAGVPGLCAPFAMPDFGYRVMLSTDQVAPSHASPPYRPPTTIS